jgi:hypothetical protein
MPTGFKERNKMADALGLSPSDIELLLGACQVVLGIGVAVFAGMEWGIHRGEVKDRKRAAFGVLFTELVRLDMHRGRTNQADVVRMVREKVLPRELFTLSDPGLILQSFGEVGGGTVILGGMVFQRLDTVVQQVRALEQAVATEQPEATLLFIEAGILEGLSDAAETFKAALQQGPKWLLSETRHVDDDLQAPSAKAFMSVIKEEVDRRLKPWWKRRPW